MLFIAITVILVAILILYMLMIKSEAKPIYYPTVVKKEDAKAVANGNGEEVPVTEKEKMFQTYFPEIKDGVQLDYPLQPIGCCPPSKEMSKDLPVANIPICYAKNSKTYLNR
jgi:hypothetical protein